MDILEANCPIAVDARHGSQLENAGRQMRGYQVHHAPHQGGAGLELPSQRLVLPVGLVLQDLIAESN